MKTIIEHKNKNTNIISELLKYWIHL
jgi:hypothetical protein